MTGYTPETPVGAPPDYAMRTREVLHDVLYITIATVSTDGRPWNSPVYAAYTPDYTFFWASDATSRHSRNIAANPNVALVIYDSTVPQGQGEGVYLEATAEALENPADVLAGLTLLDSRVGRPLRPVEQFLAPFRRRIYRAVPTAMWMNDDGEQDGEWSNFRVAVPLPGQQPKRVP